MRTTLIEFDSYAIALAAYKSEAYQKRSKCSEPEQNATIALLKRPR
jgi:uncharacterized protein (DUF1330 family)